MLLPKDDRDDVHFFLDVRARSECGNPGSRVTLHLVLNRKKRVLHNNTPLFHKRSIDPS